MWLILFQFVIKLTFPIRSLLDKNDWTPDDWANLLCLQSLLPDHRLALFMALIVVCSLTPTNCHSFCIVLAIIPRISTSLPVRSEFERRDKNARLLAIDIKFSTNDLQVCIFVEVFFVLWLVLVHILINPSYLICLSWTELLIWSPQIRHAQGSEQRDCSLCNYLLLDREIQFQDGQAYHQNLGLEV